jgi:hypothetical protein
MCSILHIRVYRFNYTTLDFDVVGIGPICNDIGVYQGKRRDEPTANSETASRSVKSIFVVSVVVGKNQTRVPQLTQQFWMFLCKELESSGFVRLNAGNI